jgi:hypothetical protein
VVFVLKVSASVQCVLLQSIGSTIDENLTLPCSDTRSYTASDTLPRRICFAYSVVCDTQAQCLSAKGADI